MRAPAPFLRRTAEDFPFGLELGVRVMAHTAIDYLKTP
jgi:hypothetical protein